MGRSPCSAREGLKRGAWSAEEDEILSNYIKTHGEGKWSGLPLKADLDRCGKSCRLRWFNYLKPGVKRGSISADEEDLIIRLHKLLGNRWSLIAGRLPGRTDNEIKNYWNSHLSKKIGAHPFSEAPKKTLARGDQTKTSSEVTSTPPGVAILTKACGLANLNPPNTVNDMKSASQSAVEPPNTQLHQENDGDEGGDIYEDWLKFTYDDMQAWGDSATGGYDFTNELCSNEEYNLGVHGETTLEWLSNQLLEDDDMMNIDQSSLDCFLVHDECPDEGNQSLKG